MKVRDRRFQRAIDNLKEPARAIDPALLGGERVDPLPIRETNEAWVRRALDGIGQ
jgi:hypothetical protein